MKSKIYLLISVLFLNYVTAQSNCGLYEVPLSDRVAVSTLVVEGIVKSSNAQWDKNRKKIYTIHEIAVTAVLKGTTAQSTVKVVTQGGEIDLRKHSFSNELELKPGNAGIFLLKESRYDLAANQTLYIAPSFSQGFIKYQKEDQSAHGPFDHFETTTQLANELQKIKGINFYRLKPIPWDTVSAARVQYVNPASKATPNPLTNLATMATISGFSPTTVQAGREVQLTITGSGFGASRGSNYVSFKYASDGGGSYIQPYNNQYVSWSDSQIVVKVPSNAGTGNIRLYIDGTEVTSTGILTVEYAILNIESTFNSNTSEYTCFLRDQNSTGGYTFKYTSDVPADGKTYFQKATKDWVCATGAHFFVSNTPSLINSIANDDENTLDYEALGVASGLIAQVSTYASGCLVGGTTLNWYVDELDARVNSSLVFYYGTATSFAGFDFYTAILHEMGHASQVGHVIDASKLMHYSLSYGEYKRTIDTAALNAGNYWTGQSTTTTRCGKAIHRILNCTSSVSLSASIASINENGTSFTLTATQNQINFSDVVVNLAYSGTATSATDYVAPASITIPAGSLSATATITITDDAVYEGNETISIDISTVTEGTENGTQSVTVTIDENETIPTVSLLGGASVDENSGNTVIISASLSGATSTSTSIYISRSGAATFNADYLLSTVIITIPAGSLSGFLTLTLMDDNTYEENETAILGISTIVSSSGVSQNGTQQRTITIIDNDSPPTVSLSTAATAIAETSGSTTVTATLSAVSGKNTTVELGLTGTANSTTDYTLATSITIPAGSTSASVNIDALNDVIYEGNQTVVVDITAVTNATENGIQQKTITITDDDAAPTVSIATSNSGNTVYENTGSLTIIATLSAASEVDTTINFSFSGTATYNIDYTFANSVVIPAGSTTVNIIYAAVDDTLWETLEILHVNVDTVINGTENGTQALTLYILDNEAAPTVNITVGSPSINEANSASTTITATLSKVSEVNTIVNLAYSGTATYNADYTASTSITVPAGSLQASITLTVTDDAIFEDAETVIIDVPSIVNALENGTQQQTITINDNDTAPAVTLSTGAISIAENNGSTTITATLSAVSEAITTVNLGFSGSATASTDYSLESSITIPACSLSGSITLNTVNDLIYEGSETVVIDIASVTNGTELGTQQKTVTITDDETTPKLSITTATSSIGENGGSYTVTANLSNATTSDVSFFLLDTGSASFGTDFTVPFSNIIPAGSTSLSVTVTIVDDNLYEVNETVTLNIGTVVTNAIRDEANKQVTTLILNNDFTQPNVSLSVNTATIAENGGTAAITATLSEVSGVITTVAIAFSGTAIYATDYSASTTITIPAGSLSASVFLNSINDGIYEPNENILVDIILISDATENGVQQQTITITDDDSNNAPSVTLSVSATSVSESSATMPVFTATLSAVSGSDTTVYLTTGGFAINNTDYTLSSNPILIPAGSLSGTTILNIINDNLYEVGETVIVQINTVTNGTENGTQSQTVTITNDEARPTVTLSVSAATVPETGGAVVTITSTLSEVSAVTAATSYTYTGTATNGTDYTISGSSLINAGSLTSTRTLTITADAIQEGDETVIIDITNCTQCTENGVQQQTITILDDDSIPTVSLTVDTNSISENSGVSTITANLSDIYNQDVTANLSFSGTAVLNSDYNCAASIVIPAGSLSSSIDLNAINDAFDGFDKTLTIDITSVTNGAENGMQQQTITIVDEDDAPTASLSVSTNSVPENGGSGSYIATLSAISEKDVTLNLSFVGQATLNNDFTVSSSTITILAGSTTGTVTMSTINDAIVENNENANVSVVSATNATLIASDQWIDIIDDDAPTVSLSVSSGSIAENGGNVVVTATLSFASPLDTIVLLDFSGSAINTVDYSVTDDAILIPAGSLSVSITINAVDDNAYELSETIIIDIAAAEDSAQQQTITVTDDDNLPLVSLSFSETSFSENGGSTTLTATLSGVHNQNVTVNCLLSGVASQYTDYDFQNVYLTIPAGSLSKSVTITAIDDNIYEGNEIFNIAITNVYNGLENGIQMHNLTIIDDESEPVVSLSKSETFIAENGGSFNILASLSHPSVEDVTIYLDFFSAQFDVDFSTNGLDEITIPAGQLDSSITVTAIDDTLANGNLTLSFKGSGIINGNSDASSSLNGAWHHVIIIDNETPPVSMISLKLFLEGYYNTSDGLMQPAMMNQGVTTNPHYADDITVELRNASTGALAATTIAQLQTNGTALAIYDTAFAGSYYIVVKHRNSIETWSATPRTVGTTPISYDFTNAAGKAFGNNMKEVEPGVFAFYSGDINQDEAIDNSDGVDLLNDIDNSEFGVKVTDLNGDGSVDNSDAPYFFNNAENSVFSVHP